MELDINLDVNIRKSANCTQNITNHTVISSHTWVNEQAHSDKTSRHGVKQVILLCLQRGDSGADRSALKIVIAMLEDSSWPDFNLHTHFQNTFKDAPSNNPTC